MQHRARYFSRGGEKLNSVGVEEVEHYYFADIGFEEEDSTDYAEPARRDFVTGGSVMFRRECLDDVGPWDEDFIMFMEDVDYSLRCRKKEWQLWYAPQSILYHQYHGSTSQALCEYFCTRNRFFLVAKHFPDELVGCIPTSHFYKKGEYDLLYRFAVAQYQGHVPAARTRRPCGASCRYWPKSFPSIWVKSAPIYSFLTWRFYWGCAEFVWVSMTTPVTLPEAASVTLQKWPRLCRNVMISPIYSITM